MPAGPGEEQTSAAPQEEEQQQNSGPPEVKQIGRANDMVSASFGDLMVSRMDNQEQAKRRVGAA